MCVLTHTQEPLSSNHDNHFFGLKCGNMGNGVYTFESTWHIPANASIRCGYMYRSHCQEASETCIFWIVVSLSFTQWTWNTNYSYKLLTTFKVVCKVIHNSLPPTTVNTICITSHTNLCHLTSNCCQKSSLFANRLPCNACFSLGIISQPHRLGWEEQERCKNFTPPTSENINSVCWVSCSIM
jgi:hypothetical protein